MPDVTLPIRDLHASVERHVHLGVIKDLMEIVKISHRTPVNYYGVDNKATQHKSTLGDLSGSQNRWGYDERVFVEVEEEANKDYYFSSTLHRADHLHTFADDKLGIYIKPVYSVNTVKVSFKYRTTDRNQATMWRNALRMKIMLQNGVNLHEVGYNYHLPEEFLLILLELHRCREKEPTSQYGQTFGDYFTEHLSSNVSSKSNLSGRAAAWTVDERQIRIQGYFDFEGEPEKGSRDLDQDSWVVSFTYTFTYNKPIEFNMRYPIMVHQELIDQRYRPNEDVYKIEAQKRYYNAAILGLEKFSTDQQTLSVAAYEGVKIPLFDEFILSNVLPNTINLCTVLATIVPEDRRTLFNLKEMGDFAIADDVLRFIEVSEHPFMGKLYQSVLGVVLYEDAKALPTGTLEVLPDLTVRAIRDLDLRKTYRVRLHLCVDLSTLPIAAVSRIQTDRKAGKLMADHIDSALRTVGGRKDIKKKMLTDEEYALMTSTRLKPNHGRHSIIHYVLDMTTNPVDGGPLV